MNIENQMGKNELGNRKIQKLILVLIFFINNTFSFLSKINEYFFNSSRFNAHISLLEIQRKV
ncbi:hypothetical protein PB01_01350 [Psychrobacillus glaciei]|uniref:Uncharacterized protein n=1 Tax=Psychrobacillus glaciei TaxID=2283160 RepID=A0A5J6SI17_9BACI|nr:hypothetical protein PB01_01350 [Psychrobacillus glaciei]